MTAKKESYGGLAILTAITASLCCITPVLAIIAGIGGTASAFSWLEPFRPYLIGITVGILAFAWYQKLRKSKSMNCDCVGEKKPFLQTKKFLGIVTFFAGILLAFPNFSYILYPNNQTKVLQVNQKNLESAKFNIIGMTCKGCEVHITHAVNKLDGIQSVKASYQKGQAIVQFDNTKTNKDEIAHAINVTGYKVSN
jgi:copper chaperone CopZ